MSTELRAVQLLGGPLDGDQFLVGADSDGAYLVVPGESARAVYEPRPGDDPDVWHFGGYID